jgi:hypothetical protein
MERYERVIWMSKAADPTKQQSFVTNEVNRFGNSKKRQSVKRKFKRYRGSNDRLDSLVLETVHAVVSELGNNRFCAEELAVRLNIRVDQIKQSFARMNQKGIISQATRHCAHDTNRAWMFYGPAHGWAPNYYHLYRQD